MAEPKLEKLNISYSVGVKANIGNYESSDAHLSRTEQWDVSGLDPAAVSSLWNDRYTKLKGELDLLIMVDYNEMSVFATAGEEKTPFDG